MNITKASMGVKVRSEVLRVQLERDDDCRRIRLRFSESMAGESRTHCATANNTFGRGFEGETGVGMTNPDTFGLESPADGWEDCAAVRCTSSSCGNFFFDFRWVEMVANKLIWKGKGTAAVKDHEFVEAASSFSNKVPRSSAARARF